MNKNQSYLKKIYGSLSSHLKNRILAFFLIFYHPQNATADLGQNLNRPK
jgi:hypothetical protein